MALDPEIQTSLEEAKTNILRIGEEVKKHIPKIQTDLDEHGKVNAELRGKFDKIASDLVLYEKTLSELKAKVEKPALQTDKEDVLKRNPAARKAVIKDVFGAKLNENDIKAILETNRSLVEAKVIQETDFTQGGSWVPPDWANELIRPLRDISPFRALARVSPTSRDALIIPKRTGQLTVGYTSELGTRVAQATTAYTGSEKIPVHESYAIVPMSYAAIEDAMFNIEAEITQDLREAFAAQEGADFMTGTGVTRPEGLLINAALVASRVNSGDANLLTYTGMVNLIYKNNLKAGYITRGSWIVSPSGLGGILLLVDGQSRPLWDPSALKVGKSATILSYSYELMPDLQTEAAGNYPLAFGSWQDCYRIVDRAGLRFKRIEDSTLAKIGQFELHSYRRYGGQVVLAEAARLQFIGA